MSDLKPAVVYLTSKVKELKKENEELVEKKKLIQSAADRNSVKMSKVLRQNRAYLEQINVLKNELEMEKERAFNWQNGFNRLFQYTLNSKLGENLWKKVKTHESNETQSDGTHESGQTTDEDSTVLPDLEYLPDEY